MKGKKEINTLAHNEHRRRGAQKKSRCKRRGVLRICNTNEAKVWKSWETIDSELLTIFRPPFLFRMGLGLQIGG